MSQTVEVPLWFLLFYLIAGIVLMALDGWRAKAWSRVLEEYKGLREKRN